VGFRENDAITHTPSRLYAKVRVIFILSAENIVFGPRGGVGVPEK